MIVAIVNQKGGTGKTTIAVNLAFGTANAKYSTALVDADSQETCLYFYGDQDIKNLTVCAAGDDVRETVKKLTKDHRFVFIDTAPHDNDSMYLAMVTADLIIIPTRPRPFDLHSSEKVVEMLRSIENDYGYTPCYFLLNQVKHGTILGRETLDYGYCGTDHDKKLKNYLNIELQGTDGFKLFSHKQHLQDVATRMVNSKGEVQSFDYEGSFSISPFISTIASTISTTYNL